MSRVSENSNANALRYSINKAKRKLEDLQIKGTMLKSVTKAGDAPMKAIESLNLTSQSSDNEQYIKNSEFALMYLNITENSIGQLTEILTKAKEIAIGQASDFYNAEVRGSVAMEVEQLRNQAISIGNRRIGNRYIFSGYNTLTRPFNPDGTYNGDDGQVSVEVAKDVYVPVNVPGSNIFLSTEQEDTRAKPLENFEREEFTDKENVDQIPEFKDSEFDVGRELASVKSKVNTNEFAKQDNIFAQLETLNIALINNDTDTIQSLLDKFDESINRIITIRSKLGSISNSIEMGKNDLEVQNLNNARRKSYLVDADVAELFSEIQKQENILRTAYKSGNSSINISLMDFIR